jgi:hypothetical protein
MWFLHLLLGLPRSLLPVGLYFRACCGSRVFPIVSTCFTKFLWYSTMSWVIFLTFIFALSSVFLVSCSIYQSEKCSQRENAACSPQMSTSPTRGGPCLGIKEAVMNE